MQGINNNYGVDRFVKWSKTKSIKTKTEADLYWDNVILFLKGQDDSPIRDLSLNNTPLNLQSSEKSLLYQKFEDEYSINTNTSGILALSTDFIVNQFTCEMYFYHFTGTTYPLFTFAASSVSANFFRIQGQQIIFAIINSSQTRASQTIPDLNFSGWKHLAICRELDQIRMYLNGTLVGTFDWSSSLGHTSGFSIPTVNNGQLFFDELRFTKDICRYTEATFTLPINRYRSSNDQRTEIEYGLQYSPSVPIEAINKRPIYNNLGLITNHEDWNVNYQRPKARVSLIYTNTLVINTLTPLAWYDASDTSSITLVDTNRVSQWRDKSGNDWHAIENTSSARPTYNLYQQNGLPLITCRESGIGMTTTLNITSPFTIVLICRQASGSNGRVVQSGSINALMAPSRSSNAFFVNGTVTFTGMAPINSFSLTTMIIGGSPSELWYNDVNYGSGTHSNWGTFCIATRGQWNENPQAEIAEIIISDRRLSTEDRLKIQEYSLNKWGV